MYFNLMNKRMKKNIAMTALVLCILVASRTGSLAEDLSDKVRESIRQRIETADMSKEDVQETDLQLRSTPLAEFYHKTEYYPVWSDENEISPLAESLLDILNKSGCEGLRPEDYRTESIRRMLFEFRMGRSRQIALDSAQLAEFDMLLTDAMLQYASHLIDGRINHQVVYPGWVVQKEPFDLTSYLLDAVESGEVEKALADLLPKYPGYAKLKEALGRYQRLAESENWSIIPYGPKMMKGASDQRVPMLRHKLFALRDLTSAAEKGDNFFDGALEAAIIRFQKGHGLKADGRVGPLTLDALNVPLKKRIKQIALNMERLRWLSGTSWERYIMVNITDFSLQLIDNGQVAMNMKIIVGKTEQSSCILSRKMPYLELNPYWRIPDSIATKEILPKLRKNPGYLAANRVRVFSRWEDSMKEVDPRKINWSRIKAEELGYKFRQEPGPLNPLGRIKFIFPNECEIYLHDTPKRYLFGKSRRDFSHGCIRIEKPIELAAYLLKGRESWTRTKIMAEIGKEKRQVVTLPDPIDVHIIYGTVWVDRDGNLQFRNDIYRVDQVPYELTSCESHHGEDKDL